jgi:hypothetical protein
MTQIKCARCGQLHDVNEMEVGYTCPDAYFQMEDAEKKHRAFCNDDLCAIDGKGFYLRGVLELPVRGSDSPFGWGIWVEVAKEHFDRYVALFDNPEQGREPPFPGAVANALPGYPTTLGVTVSAHISKVETPLHSCRPSERTGQGTARRHQPTAKAGNPLGDDSRGCVVGA